MHILKSFLNITIIIFAASALTACGKKGDLISPDSPEYRAEKERLNNPESGNRGKLSAPPSKTPPNNEIFLDTIL